MTIYVQQGAVVGQPMSPFFGAQNGLGQTPIIQQPTSAPTNVGMQATGVQMTLLEAVSRGIIPRNAQLATIAGQPVAAGISVQQGDGVTVDEAFSSGNGTQVNGGVAVPPAAGNNVAVTTMGVNNQFFVQGGASTQAASALSTGPCPTNNESVVSAPLAHSVTTANVTLLAGVYQG